VGGDKGDGSAGMGVSGTGGSGSADAGPTLRSAAEASGRLFGAALNSTYLSSSAVHAEIAGRDFKYATAEWEMKWEPTEPSPSQFAYASAAAHEADPDALLFYNESNIDWSESKLEAMRRDVHLEPYTIDRHGHH
jgi:GH35 family endo-1,4-beta-xylanase